MGVDLGKPMKKNNISTVDLVITNYLLQKETKSIFQSKKRKSIKKILSDPTTINSIHKLSKSFISKSQNNLENNINMYNALIIKDKPDSIKTEVCQSELNSSLLKGKKFKQFDYDELSLQEYLNKEVKELRRSFSEQRFNHLVIKPPNLLEQKTKEEEMLLNTSNISKKIDNLVSFSVSPKSLRENYNIFSKRDSRTKKSSYISFRGKARNLKSFPLNTKQDKEAKTFNRKVLTKNQSIGSLEVKKPISRSRRDKRNQLLTPSSSKTSIMSKLMTATANTSRNISCGHISKCLKIRIDLRELIKE